MIAFTHIITLYLAWTSGTSGTSGVWVGDMTYFADQNTHGFLTNFIYRSLFKQLILKLSLNFLYYLSIINT
jgi:hypothetical protein